MHIALDGGEQHLPRLLRFLRTTCLDERLQDAHGLLHRSCRLHHLGQEHLAAAEELAHGVHRIHQRSLDNLHRVVVLLGGFVKVRLQIVSDALHERVLQSLLKGAASPIVSTALR